MVSIWQLRGSIGVWIYDMEIVSRGGTANWTCWDMSKSVALQSRWKGQSLVAMTDGTASLYGMLTQASIFKPSKFLSLY